METKNHRSQVADTWNGGAGGHRVRFVSNESGVAGENECFAWILDHTPFSVHEAITRQGYVIEAYDEPDRAGA